MDWLEKIPEFLKMSWSEVSKVMIGVFLTGFLALGWVRTSRRHAAARVKAIKAETLAEIEKQRAEAHKALAAQAEKYAEQSKELHQANSELQNVQRQLATERDQFQRQLESLQAHFEELKTFDGKLWDRELRAAPPPFVPAGQRRTRFIAVANLKGGVGKTTVAANVGMALARRGKNVLMVDLDFQGSLTRLCASFQDQRELVRRGETVRALFDLNGAAPGDWLQRVIRIVAGTPSGCGACDFIAASDNLADAELREEARWFVARDPDARFLFRRIFHSPDILNRYDYVFFDCPPRLTIAGVNAWAASDWLLVPVILDQQSVQAVPRTLEWLRRLQMVSPARLLGIVANQVVYRVGKPTASFQTALDQMPDYLKRSGHSLNGAFIANVKADQKVISSAVGAGKVPAIKDDGAELFKDLADQIEKAAHT